MTVNAGDIGNVYPLRAGKRDRLHLQARAAIGAVGVVTVPLTYQDDPGIAIVRGGSAGLYNVTFPKGADAQGTIDVALISAAGTVKSFFIVTLDMAGGTASFQTSNAAGAATDPAVSDSLVVTVTPSMRRDF